MGKSNLLPGAADCVCHFQDAGFFDRLAERNKAHHRAMNVAVLLGILLSVTCQISTIAAAIGAESSVSGQSAFVSGHCSNALYINGSTYHRNVEQVFWKLRRRVIRSKIEIWEEASDAYDNLDTVYGVASCSKLSAEECKVCLTTIVTNLPKWCPQYALNADIILEDCSMRYNNYYMKVPSVAET